MTEPIKEILPREMHPEVKVKLLSMSNLIDEFVNFGTHVMTWIIHSSKGSDAQLPLTMFFRDMLEKADSISSLIKMSNVEPSKIILRSVFEISLYIKYLLDDNFEDRSMAFLVCNAKRKIRTYKAFDKNDPAYKTTIKLLEQDELLDPSFLENFPSLEKPITNQYEILKLPHYQRITNEYERTKKGDKRTPNWYRLFNGPRNIQELAKKVNIPFLYVILYRKWSESVHGTEILTNRIVKSQNSYKKEGKVNVDIIQMNLPIDVQEVASYTLILMLMIFIKLRDKKLQNKEKEIMDWYISIKNHLHQIIGGKKLININI